MNLNGKLIFQIDKNRTHSKKDLLSNNKIKIINLILSKKPISFLSNLKYKNIKLVHKGIGHSLQNSCLQKPKRSFVDNSNNIKRIQAQDFSNYENTKSKRKIKQNIDNLKKRFKNKSFCNINKIPFDIPLDNISYIKKKKYMLKNQSNKSIKKLILKKSKSMSISRNINIKRYTFEGSAIFDKITTNNKSICSINRYSTSKNNNLNKQLKNINQDIKNKISLFIKEQKKNKSKKIIKSYNCLKNVKSSEKINTYGNITTNNSDKENTDFSTKKNNLTTHSNNIPYFTTNFNNSTNITETNNNEFISENMLLKPKKAIKKKLGLPFHPNSKKLEHYHQIESKNYLLIKNNNEINIPYNKKNNKRYKTKIENLPFNKYEMKRGKFIINHSARNKNNNNSFFDFSSNTKNDNYIFRSNNCIDSFDSSKGYNKSCIYKNNNLNILRNEDLEKEEMIGVETAHFRIVRAIQESKKLLSL